MLFNKTALYKWKLQHQLHVYKVSGEHSAVAKYERKKILTI